MIDPSAERLADADAAGASWTATPEAALGTAGKQDIVFVTAGAPGRSSWRCTGRGRRNVVLYGAFPKEFNVPDPAGRAAPPRALDHRRVNQEPEDWRAAAGLIASGALAADLDALVTARYPLAAVADAFALAANSPVYRVLVGDAP